MAVFGFALPGLAGQACRCCGLSRRYSRGSCGSHHVCPAGSRASGQLRGCRSQLMFHGSSLQSPAGNLKLSAAISCARPVDEWPREQRSDRHYFAQSALSYHVYAIAGCRYFDLSYCEGHATACPILAFGFVSLVSSSKTSSIGGLSSARQHLDNTEKARPRRARADFSIS